MKSDDRFNENIREMFEEETGDIVFTNEMMDAVLKKTTRSKTDTIRRILNYEVQIPLIPAAVGVAALLALSILPGDIFRENPNFTVIDMGGSQVFVREDREVTRR